jgi:hypothetical protein
LWLFVLLCFSAYVIDLVDSEILAFYMRRDNTLSSCKWTDSCTESFVLGKFWEVWGHRRQS